MVMRREGMEATVQARRTATLPVAEIQRRLYCKTPQHYKTSLCMRAWPHFIGGHQGGVSPSLTVTAMGRLSSMLLTKAAWMAASLCRSVTAQAVFEASICLSSSHSCVISARRFAAIAPLDAFSARRPL